MLNFVNTSICLSLIELLQIFGEIRDLLSGTLTFILKPRQPKVAFHIKISHLICTANQMAGFYKKCNIGLKPANPFLDTVLLLFHLKTSKNLEVFCFKGGRKGELKLVKISSAGYLSLFIMELLKVSHETYVEQTVESISISWIKRFIGTWSRMYNMHLIIMNCFCGMVGRRKALSLISSWDHCPRFSPLQMNEVVQ